MQGRVFLRSWLFLCVFLLFSSLAQLVLECEFVFDTSLQYCQHWQRQVIPSIVGSYWSIKWFWIHYLGIEQFTHLNELNAHCWFSYTPATNNHNLIIRTSSGYSANEFNKAFLNINAISSRSFKERHFPLCCQLFSFVKCNLKAQ